MVETHLMQDGVVASALALAGVEAVVRLRGARRSGAFILLRGGDR